MKRSRHAPAVTSLPLAPQAEADGRVRRYVITMAIRIICFALMVLVTPYGWYTWVFGAAAAFLPYIAVVFANATSSTADSVAESPVYELDAPASDSAPQPDEPQILTIRESTEDEKQ